jgi:AcrR family transcriptional regulator
MSARVERKNRATVEAIVEAAEHLLAERGVAAVTLEAVADRADVAVQTIYNRVGGRPAVLRAVAESALAANHRYLDAAHATPGGPLERIEAVAEAYVRFALERPDQYRLLAFPPADAPAPERVVELVQEQNGKLARLVAEARDAGLIRPDLDPDEMATVLWRVWDGVLGLMFRPDALRPSDDQLRSILQTTRSIVELGIHPR